jgi:hypothetical protein
LEAYLIKLLGGACSITSWVDAGKIMKRMEFALRDPDGYYVMVSAFG